MGYWEDSGEHEGSVVILDTETGKLATETGAVGFFWAEGNGSCDCNREDLFDVDTEGDTCIGCHRYLIVAHNYPNYSINEMNSDYPKDLINKYIKD